MGNVTEDFRIMGQVGHPAFAAWITRHAARLGLVCGGVSQSPQAVALQVTGPPDLLDAMEMGCLLGPQEVWVDRIDRLRRTDVAGGFTPPRSFAQTQSRAPRGIFAPM